jgi:hypothetical protein
MRESRCRNCGGTALRDIGTVGKVAPFFLKRVIGAEIRPLRATSPFKRAVRSNIASLISRFPRLFQQQVFVEMQICSRCEFIQTALPFHDDDIMRLYEDYRSETYNAERIHYEPSYASLTSQVARGAQEIKVRRAGSKRFLDAALSPNELPTILDYGGSDGRFIPDLPGSKFVFDISAVSPVPGVARIEKETDLAKYSIVLLAHVIEHVPHPLTLVRSVCKYIEPGGYLYIEVPQELTDEFLHELKDGACPTDLTIHEHINYYSTSAVRRLLESAELELVAIENEEVDVGWARCPFVRALGRLPVSQDLQMRS